VLEDTLWIEQHLVRGVPEEASWEVVELAGLDMEKQLLGTCLVVFGVSSLANSIISISQCNCLIMVL
jgi:hypothetical protein